MFNKMYLLFSFFLLGLNLSCINSLEDLFYGDHPSHLFPKRGNAPPYTGDDEMLLENHEIQDGRPREMLENMQRVIEDERLTYDEKDWSVVLAEDLHNDDFPEAGLPNKFYVATPKSSTQKAILSLELMDAAKLRVHYTIYIKKDELGLIEDSPLLGIYLSTNDTSTLLKQEKATAGWITSEVKFAKLYNTRLSIVAQVNNRRNQIAIGDIWQEDDSSNPSISESKLISLLETDKQVTSSYTSFGEDDSLPDVDTHDIPSEDSDVTASQSNESDIESPNDTNQSPIVNESPSDYGEINPVKVETNPELSDDSFDDDSATLSTPKPDYDEASTKNFTGGNFNETNSMEAPKGSSNSGLKIFLVLSTLVGIAAFVFIMWRRRRRRNDDEIPVFSRAAAEHHNPSFTAEHEIDPTSPNYRSFE